MPIRPQYWMLIPIAAGAGLLAFAVAFLVLTATGDGGPSVDERARELLAKTPEAEPTILVTREPAPSPAIIVPSPTVIVQEPEPSPPWGGTESTFGDGIYAVGRDIQAGTYQGGCPGGGYWARLSGFGGTLDEIIAADTPDGPTIVTISPSDVGFETRRCIWTLTP